MQLFLRPLGAAGSTTALELESSCSLGALKASVEAATGVPASEQLLVTLGGRPLGPDGASLGEAGLGPGSTLQLLLRLAGGKGGFGALLRGQGRDGKITDNFDACRDLTGRRIRSVEAEKKLKEWQKQAKERELEALALKHMKEAARQAKRERNFEINVAEVKRQHKEAADAVVEAVHSALAEGLGAGSSKAAAQQPKRQHSGGSSDGAGSSETAAAAAAAAAGEAASPSSTRHAAGSAGSEEQAGAAAAPEPAKRRKLTMLDLVEGSDDADDDSSSSDGEEGA